MANATPKHLPCSLSSPSHRLPCLLSASASALSPTKLCFPIRFAPRTLTNPNTHHPTLKAFRIRANAVTPDSSNLTNAPQKTSTEGLSDEDLRARGLAVRENAENLNLEDLNALFVRVGFPRRDLKKLERALRHTPSVIWMEDLRSGEIVAFARATGDDVYNAVIWDVVVEPSLQGSGLGKTLMIRLLGHLLSKGVCNIALFAEANVIGFYRPLGFVADPAGVKAMVYSKNLQARRRS
eukprot:TRINITY_DN7334_c0_g1_i1.p1 TRINITY_DN7334_c0_g1~~TRINITY_DN7334_c0_g1_i1.p1  ORF type:complete len:238 (-),score=1.19 TRINITY_DN7334_c0_g1_i1:343-1056(-)